MGNLTMLAEEYRMGILLIAHTNGYTDLFRPGQIGISTHWTDAARGVLNLYRGRQESERLLVVSKANWGPFHLGCQIRLSNKKGWGFGGFKTRQEGWMTETVFLEFLAKPMKETQGRNQIT